MKIAKKKSVGPAKMSAPQVFAALVDAVSYKGKSWDHRSPLGNITFWTGAGFSKSWDLRCPTGAELFTIPFEKLEDVIEPTLFSRLFGTSSYGETITFDAFQQIVYMLDMQEAHPEIRSLYFDSYNIVQLRKKLRASITTRFEEMAPPAHLDPDTQKLTLEVPSTSQDSMLQFFSKLSKHADGSNGLAEGLRYHFITTNYDFVIETILDNIVGPDDSHFLYTYRGITPSQIKSFPSGAQTHDHWLVQHLLKINGGFELLAKPSGYEFDYTKRATSEISAEPPNIILPSREQVYTDSYFREIFAKAVRLLRETHVLVLVGYSLPKEDALLRFILRQFAEEGEDGYGKHIFYIDIAEEGELRARIASVFPSVADFEVPRVHIHAGSFDDFARLCAPLI